MSNAMKWFIAVVVLIIIVKDPHIVIQIVNGLLKLLNAPPKS